MSEIKVVPFEQGMEEKLAEIHNQAFAEWRKLGEVYKYNVVSTEEVVGWDGESQLLMGLLDGKTAGYIRYTTKRDDECHAPFEYLSYPSTHGDMGQAQIAVLPPYKKKGLATALLKASFDYCRNEGIKIAIAYAYNDNHPATALLSTAGFDHTEIHYLEENDNDCILAHDSVLAELDLSSPLPDIPLNTAVTVRQPRESDLEVMIEVFGTCSPWVYGEAPDPDKVLTWIKDPWGEVTLVAEFNGLPVGAMEFDRTGLLGIPGVLPAYRPLGVGSTLFYRLLEQMKEMGYKKAVTDTGIVLPEAIRMYERFGFDTSRRQWAWVKRL